MALRKRILTMVMAIAISNPAVSQDLGVHGNVYDIEEEDVVAYIKRKLGEYEKSGEIKRRQLAAIDKVKDTVMHPKPIPGISTATTNNTYFIDPTYTQQTTVTDPQGRILVPAGTKVNPLQFGGLTHKYVFIDARDEKQVAFVMKNFKATLADRVVLTGGSWVELTKKLGRQVYYDQGGNLTRRFAITKVPAVLKQDGLRLKIEELAL